MSGPPYQMFYYVRSILHFYCAYIHEEVVDEESTNEIYVSNSAKLITIDVNGKKITVKNFDDLDEEMQ